MKYSINVQWNGTSFDVTIPEFGLKASGATRDEAVINGNKAVHAYLMAQQDAKATA
jgi:predicted RNase H-like HicB family nuclease